MEIVAVKVKGHLFAVSVEIKAPATGIGDGARHRQRPRVIDRDGVPGRRTARQRGRQSEGHPRQQDVADIRNGTDLEVDGTIADGLLTATRVKFR